MDLRRQIMFAGTVARLRLRKKDRGWHRRHICSAINVLLLVIFQSVFFQSLHQFVICVHTETLLGLFIELVDRLRTLGRLLLFLRIYQSY